MVNSYNFALFWHPFSIFLYHTLTNSFLKERGLSLSTDPFEMWIATLFPLGLGEGLSCQGQVGIDLFNLQGHKLNPDVF